MIKGFFEQLARARCSGLLSACSRAARSSSLSIFSLGIMPYISASIIFQLLTVVIPQLERLKKEGEQGQQEDQPVHALCDDRAGSVPGHGLIAVALENGFSSVRVHAVDESRLGLPPDVR